ncbi:MAG TPA: glycosyltransferase family 4 protein [Gemmataceae bacterium]|nr:glycosyltransferase family 4 protein [Gemmataceae bacterium]
MRLAALVEAPDHVCCRYRLRAFADEWHRAGHSLELFARPRGWWPRVRLTSRLVPFDVVILQRRLPSFLELASLRRRANRLVFDFDDAVFLRDSFSSKGLESHRRRTRFAAVVRAADVVVAGNPWLAERARAAGAAYVVVVPTCVEPASYPPADHESNDGVRLIWVGSSSTLRGLERARELLDQVGRTIRDVRLKLVCDRFGPFGRLPVESCVWRESTEATEIAAADIGISWLPDDDWSRGKCGLKVLQYMAAALPVIGNPVGVQADLIRHGQTGFLATTAYEWAAAVRTLAEDPDLRRRMGSAGRARVEREFSVASGAGRWCEILGALERSQRAVG